MEYFFYLSGDDPKRVGDNDSYKLGETSTTGRFWVYDGYNLMTRIIKDPNTPIEVIRGITVINNKGKKFTVHEFLDMLSQFKIVQ